MVFHEMSQHEIDKMLYGGSSTSTKPRIEPQLYQSKHTTAHISSPMVPRVSTIMQVERVPTTSPTLDSHSIRIGAPRSEIRFWTQLWWPSHLFVWTCEDEPLAFYTDSLGLHSLNNRFPLGLLNHFPYPNTLPFGEESTICDNKTFDRKLAFACHKAMVDIAQEAMEAFNKKLTTD